MSTADVTTSAVWSPFSPVTEPGFRVKLDGVASIYGAPTASIGSSGFLPQGLDALSDAMVGYQLDLGSVWIKLYAGAAYQQQVFFIAETGTTAQRPSWSAAGALETWWRPTDRIWTGTSLFISADLASIYSKVGYELNRADNGLVVSFGGEGALSAADANVFKEGRNLGLFNDYIRGGGLLNLRFGSHELSISGGLWEASDESGWHPYATISYGKKF